MIFYLQSKSVKQYVVGEATADTDRAGMSQMLPPKSYIKDNVCQQ